jgi:CheY-like chemotaxis protein
MLIRISRALLWLAAAAAIAALFGPDRDERWLSVTAAMSLLAAFAFWRAALLQRRLALEEEVMPSTHLDETALMEIAVLCARCCDDARSPTGLVEGVARLLKMELGSRSARGRVIESAPSVEAEAIERRGPGIVIEAQLDGRPVAMIELSDLALAVAPNGLNALIELVQAQVAQAMRRLSLVQALERQAKPLGSGPALLAPVADTLSVLDAMVADGPSSPVTSARADGPPGLSQRNREVLVVGENEVVQEIVGEMLRQEGCRIRQVSNPEEGLRALCDQVFDLVVVDVDQPGLDGPAGLNEFRPGTKSRYRFKTAPATPVVAITFRVPGDGSSCFTALGFDDQLDQPICPRQFKAMLKRTLRSPFAAQADDVPASGGAVHPSSAGGSVLDKQALQRLQELDPKGENNLLERVFKAFETSVARLMPQLQESLRAGDHAGVRHVAHTLKSSTASIGASRLSQQCAEIESMIRRDDTTALDSRVQAMCAEVEVVLQEVRRLMSAKG